VESVLRFQTPTAWFQPSPMPVLTRVGGLGARAARVGGPDEVAVLHAQADAGAGAADLHDQVVAGQVVDAEEDLEAGLGVVRTPAAGLAPEGPVAAVGLTGGADLVRGGEPDRERVVDRDRRLGGREVEVLGLPGLQGARVRPGGVAGVSSAASNWRHGRGAGAATRTGGDDQRGQGDDGSSCRLSFSSSARPEPVRLVSLGMNRPLPVPSDRSATRSGVWCPSGAPDASRVRDGPSTRTGS
jgi:hypothetical protein